MRVVKVLSENKDESSGTRMEVFERDWICAPAIVDLEVLDVVAFTSRMNGLMVKNLS